MGNEFPLSTDCHSRPHISYGASSDRESMKPTIKTEQCLWIPAGVYTEC